MSEEISPASILAAALDAEDYGAARAMLGDDCIYEIRNETINSADSIIASYQGNGEKGRKTFDHIVYESAVTQISGTRERIDYTDHVTHAGEKLIHRCAQEIEFDPKTRLVIRIKHIDLPGEKEALDDFKERHGW